MAKNQKSSAVVVAGNINVPATKAEVPAAIEALKAQLAALKSGIKDEVSTDCSYGSRNIKSVTKVSELLEISSSIKARSAAYDVEVECFDLVGRIKPFMADGKTAAEWDPILKKAAFELLNKAQIEKLENAIKKLSNHVSEEEKLQNELKDIMTNASELIS